MGLADGGGEDLGVGLFQEIAGSSEGFGLLDVVLLCHISKIYVDNQRVTQFCLFLKLVISC